MQQCTNVLWKLNAKGFELLNKAGVVSVTSQDLAPKEPQNLPNSPTVTSEKAPATSQLQNEVVEKTLVPVQEQPAPIENSESIQPQNNVANTILTTDQNDLACVASTTPNIPNSPALQQNANNTGNTDNTDDTQNLSTPQKAATSLHAEPTPAQNQLSVNKVSCEIEQLEPIANWHLRKKRADIFIEELSNIPYLEGLKNYLSSHDIKWQLFDPTVHYLPYDLLLISRASFKNEGECAFLEDGKAQVWAFLKNHFNFS